MANHLFLVLWLQLAAMLEQVVPTTTPAYAPGNLGTQNIGTNAPGSANEPITTAIFYVVFMIVLIGGGVAAFRWRMRHRDLW